MPRKSLPALLTALLLALPALAADRPAADPAQLQTDAYVALAQAEAALDANRPDDAAALFRQALDTYNAIARDYPDFSAATIRYRSTYCQNQLADLEARLGVASRPKPAQTAAAAAPAATPSPAPDAASKPSSRAEHELNLELAYLRSRLASLEAELTQADETESSLTSRIQLLQMETNRLARALDERADATQEDWERLLADRDEARAALDDANRRLSEADSLRPALDEAETQAAELRTRLFRLQQENETLASEAADLEKEAADASSRAMRAEARVVELEAEKLALQESLAAAQTASALRKPKSSAPTARPVHLADAIPKPEPAPAPAQPAGQAKSVASKPAKSTPSAKPAPIDQSPASTSLAFNNTPPRPIPPGTDPATFIRQLLSDGENKAALATIRQARLSAPDNLTLALLEGTALIRLEAYDDASAILIPLARANPKHAEIHATLGAAMMGAGDYDQARDTLEKAIKLDKKQALAHHNLALLYAFTSPVKEKLARRHYRDALALGIDPDPALEPFR